MTTLITIAIIWGMICSIVLMVIGWRLVHALEGLAQAQAFIANGHRDSGHADQTADSKADDLTI